MKIAIIGAGPSGLAAAQEFTKNGIEVAVYESDTEVGGLAKCLDMWGHPVEMGPHFLLLRTQDDVKVLLDDLLKTEIYKFDRMSRIYLDGKFYDYPPRPFNIVKNMGAAKTVAAVGSVLNELVSPTKNTGTVESYVQSSLGNYMYKNFFKGYTEKLWGIPCNAISDEYAKTLIGFDKLNLTSIAKKLFADKNVELHRQCIYPQGGMALIWKRLKDRIEQQGGKIHLGTNIKGLVLDGKHIKGLVMPDGESRMYDYIFSSVPEAAILRMLPDVPKELVDELKQIQFRRVLLVYLQLENTDFIEDNTIYIYSDQVKAARVTNFNRFRNEPGNDVIMCEYWTSDKEEMWTYTPEQMLAVAKKDLQIFAGADKLKIKDYKLVQMKNAYPVPDMKLADRKELLANYMKQYEGFSALGRANQKKFNFGMETAMVEGINAARQIIEAFVETKP